MHPHGSKKRLTPGAAINYPGDTLFDQVARAVCRAGCLPRKELYESWAMATRVRRRFRGGRIVDLAAGHGLLGALLLLLDPSASGALAVDARVPESAARLKASLAGVWPRLGAQWVHAEGDLAAVPLERTDLVVSAHACGHLTDLVLERALGVGARVVVLPCCQAVGKSDRGGLDGWLDPALAVDVMRAERLARRGYQVHTQLIPAEITPKNRLLFGHPPG